jgi:caffeoyl-CoA O-methyltransferase
MKKHRGKPLYTITDPDIEAYSETMTTAESKEVLQLMQESDQELQYVDMLSGRIVGKLLQMLVQMSGARRILEIGTFTGYSALMMSEVLAEGGVIYTCEMNLRYIALARDFFTRFDKKGCIHLIEGNAMKNIDTIEGNFDLIYLDGDKMRYPEYFSKLKKRIPSGGLMLADNVLWDGMVLNPEDPKSEAIHRFNKMVHDDVDVEQVLLPIRDGLNLIRKK